MSRRNRAPNKRAALAAILSKKFSSTDKEAEDVCNKPKDAFSPKSFVIRYGKHISSSLAQLGLDLRHVLEPNTASKLRERKSNTLKDYQAIAGSLGITHFFILSQRESSGNCYLKMARFPQGPSLIFKIPAYSLISDVLEAQKRPKPLGLDAYRTSPLLILNGFDMDKSEDKLVCSMLQHAFPVLNTKKMRLNDLRRVIIFQKLEEDNQDENPSTPTIVMRHYQIGVKHVGLSKPIKKLFLKPDSTLSTSLSTLQDISDIVLKEASLALLSASSDSEADPEDTVTLGQPYKGEPKSTQRAVALRECGPRMTLQLQKITDGFLDGHTLYEF